MPRPLATTAIFVVTLLASFRTAPADDKPAAKDDALDTLLRKLDEPKAEAKKDKDAAKPAKPGAPKPSGDLSTKDKDLDSLLEKLGTTEDTPSLDDPKKNAGAGGKPEPDQPDGGKTDPSKEKKPPKESLTGKARDLDEHLEELSGVRRKKKNKPAENEGGPLSEVIKQMRDVEQRLGQPDTGEETRKKQEQIVKRIETLIEQMQQSGGQSRLRMRRSLSMKPGQQPGGKPGQTPGTTGGNAPFTKPQKPTDRHSLVGGKDVWGHLPEEMRLELENVAKEEPLTSREDLIRRYYLSVSKKTLTRGE